MALADLAAYNAALENPRQRVGSHYAGVSATAARGSSIWGITEIIPTTAAVAVRTSGGLEYQAATGGRTMRILRSRLSTNATHGTITICDRLSHQGGLDGTTVGAQTTNLPTAALTRYTSGVGVKLGIEIYTQIGLTAVGLTASYTNQAGTPGKITQAIAYGNTSYREARRFIDLPLASGDSGVRSVESVTLDNSTGTAGNFGVTLYKPLLMLYAEETRRSGTQWEALIHLGAQFPEVVDTACLWEIMRCQNNAINNTTELSLAEV